MVTTTTSAKRSSSGAPGYTARCFTSDVQSSGQMTLTFKIFPQGTMNVHGICGLNNGYPSSAQDISYYFKGGSSLSTYLLAIFVNGTQEANNLPYSDGDTLKIVYDFDLGTCTFYIANVVKHTATGLSETSLNVAAGGYATDSGATDIALSGDGPSGGLLNPPPIAMVRL